MAEPARKHATYADVLATPDNMVAEIIDEATSISLADLWPLDRPLGFVESPQHLFSGDR